MEFLAHLFSGFRWQDGLDILLNTYILFRLYIIFRGTTVFRAILRICLLWAVGQVAINLGLILTNWAMQGVIAVAALMIVIVFRNEISGVLQGRTIKSFLWEIPKRQDFLPYQTIIESVYEMARKKIGALIVIPMYQSIDSFVQGGVIFDCQLSQQSLTGTFWPGSPLHDGACIIKGDRITKAGVILPLSISKDIPAFFGTRHRAAMGLAGKTDAMVIVVSEERGEISIFTKEHRQVINDRKTMEKMLKAHTETGSEQTKSGRQTFGLALAAFISLVFVTGLWFSFSKGMETFAIQEVPLEFSRLNQKMEITESSPSYVKLHISGARPLIDALKPDRIKIKINLAQCKSGENILSITRKNISLPPGLRLKSIEPAQVNITLDTLMEKRLPVQPHWTGKLPKGLMLTKAVPIPEHVTVTAGQRILQGIHTIFTEPISLDTLTASGTVQVPMIAESASLKFNGPDTVQVEYTIIKREQAHETETPAKK